MFNKPSYNKLFERPIFIKKADKRFVNKLKCVAKYGEYHFTNSYSNKIFVKLDKNRSKAYIAVGVGHKNYFSVTLDAYEKDEDALQALTDSIIFFHISGCHSLNIFQKLGFVRFSDIFQTGQVFLPEKSYNSGSHIVDVYDVEFHLDFKKLKGISLFDKWEISGISMPTMKYYSLAGICFEVLGLDSVYHLTSSKRFETTYSRALFIERYKKFINIANVKKLSIFDTSFLAYKENGSIILRTVMNYEEIVNVFPTGVVNHIVYKSKLMYKLCSLFGVSYSYHIGLERSRFLAQPYQPSFVELECVINKDSVAFNIKKADNPAEFLKLLFASDEKRLTSNFMALAVKYPSDTMINFFVDNGIIANKNESFGEDSVAIFDMYTV